MIPTTLKQIFRWLLPRQLSGKEPATNVGDMGSIPGSGRPPGGRNGNPLLYSHLGSPTDS